MNMQMKEISGKVLEAGVVGAGGAGFPTHVKLSAQAEIVIVNGAECEPLLKTDQQLAARYPDLLVKGLTLAMASTGAQKGIIALKAKYKEAIAALEPYIRNTEGIEIAIMPDIYPAGDEVMTIWLTTGRRVPPGGIPINIGVVVNNVQTLINVAKAQEGISVTTRTLTVTGAVKKPITVTVPIGTPLREVLDLAGGEEADLAYINGGPMMGKLISDLSDTVTKTTGGLIGLPRDHMLIQRKESSVEGILRIAKTVCEQCSFCTDLCPRHMIGHELSPHLLIRAVNYKNLAELSLLATALTCSECGVCEAYACPVGISPLRVNVALKAELRSQGIKYQGELGKADPMAQHRLIPSSRLMDRLRLRSFYKDAPLAGEVYEGKEVRIKLQQHIGAPAAAVVKEGDVVEAGQRIGEIPSGALGANIHASISGTVTQVTPQAITIRKGGAAR
ncbi:putative NADH:ubiquinone oxidoreductase, subunit RnfC [Desulfosporosinus orientis DSM 765]|uniref:Putative NADH:ubiquinone oxidoreductase, subunit RnfC n=1 Tax=Desulfosporosinus orientis (strain ATCC 19365 / DSM 765 / NCIMB 8382 / VKM B-1628 / Singapore I) TaxID=768706 RepID=G7WB42_DESOD|nr:4Fe-4S dicluster domain-containing protein [Desulfosporosinus orientis]AET67543.1 putative NADH:ubiquinone oxidoreductase, subunit RnfC [Desulfosporosinus orientis DSM 765]